MKMKNGCKWWIIIVFLTMSCGSVSAASNFAAVNSFPDNVTASNAFSSAYTFDSNSEKINVTLTSDTLDIKNDLHDIKCIIDGTDFDICIYQNNAYVCTQQVSPGNHLVNVSIWTHPLLIPDTYDYTLTFTSSKDIIWGTNDAKFVGYPHTHLALPDPDNDTTVPDIDIIATDDNDIDDEDRIINIGDVDDSWKWNGNDIDNKTVYSPDDTAPKNIWIKVIAILLMIAVALGATDIAQKKRVG